MLNLVSVQRTKKPAVTLVSDFIRMVLHSKRAVSFFFFSFNEAKCQTPASVIFKIILARSVRGGLGIHLSREFTFLRAFQSTFGFA